MKHRHKNRPSKLPVFDRAQATGKQCTPRSADSRTQSPAEDEDEDEPPSSRARRHSKKHFRLHSENPTQLLFYPEHVQQVLMAAKMNWRLWIVMEWAFPNYLQHKNDISDCLTRAIAAFEADSGVLDEGGCSVSFIGPSDNIFQGYFPDYHTSMIKLVCAL